VDAADAVVLMLGLSPLTQVSIDSTLYTACTISSACTDESVDPGNIDSALHVPVVRVLMSPLTQVI
jgi:hypothetical protein